MEALMMSSQGFNFVQEYWIDAWQRSVLMLDVLRQRGNTHLEVVKRLAPHALTFEFEVVRDGRSLPRPVNYALTYIVPPEGTKIGPSKPPFVVVDPRAGHGPGIGGMKQESEIGVALAAGHPCYFIGFLPHPVPGQTVEDVCTAEAAFIDEVASRHPQADGKPVIVANCQAGWQIMMMAAIRPQSVGPILLVGSPLSYWAGVPGLNPMRYAGGILGGTWMTALAGDLGNGIFDGANLVANFEWLNPANTCWNKGYNVYSKIDTEASRFLEFETWWGSPVLLNAGEMQWITDNLFVGNKLTSGEIRTTDGICVDLRNIQSPIIVLCSWGDDITPPQQALGWVTDLYGHEDEIVANGQTIVYTLHQTIGHLGIFVSGRVATKEHAEFASCMEMIDLMPPGLYEAVIEEVAEGSERPDLIQGKYLLRLEARTLDDIRRLGANSEDDNKRFATVARVSEITNGLYRTLVRPAVQAMVTDASAELMRGLHPHRMGFSYFSDRNPVIAPVQGLAEQVRANRRPVAADNPLLAYEKVASTWISTWWDGYRQVRDAATEAIFLGTYGSPLMQAMVGLGAEQAGNQQRSARDLLREGHEARMRADLSARFETGGLPQAVLRALIYVRLPERSVDERAYAMLNAIRAMQPVNDRMSLTDLKAVLKEQFLLLRLDEEHAVRAIPRLLPDSTSLRSIGLQALHRMLEARPALTDEGARRLARIEALFADNAMGDRP
jgi:pimeloyl-ACP methyl ester carboxylesterase